MIVLNEKSGNHKLLLTFLQFILRETWIFAPKTFHSKAQTTTSWCERKSQGIINVIRIHCLGTLNVQPTNQQTNRLTPPSPEPRCKLVLWNYIFVSCLLRFLTSVGTRRSVWRSEYQEDTLSTAALSFHLQKTRFVILILMLWILLLYTCCSRHLFSSRSLQGHTYRDSFHISRSSNSSSE